MLLAEYSRYNEPVRDYIYIGGRLLAEYKPQESRTYFYTPDQINSTRIVTDGTGTVVYSAAHDPYGGIQQTWVNTFDPTPKFSGKERDSESQLDYFGARYYDRAQYRFISVDPIYRKATSDNQQKWNLYAYCENNPLTLFDPNGEEGISAQKAQKIIDAAFGWANPKRTPYADSTSPYCGRGAVKGIGADCCGSVWAIYAEAGFEYSYGNARKEGEESFVEKAVNTGFFKEVEEGASLQAGDVGLWDGHMVIYAGKDKDGNILVYSATTNNKFLLCPLWWFTNDPHLGDDVTWYRYEEKEPAK